MPLSKKILQSGRSKPGIDLRCGADMVMHGWGGLQGGPFVVSETAITDRMREVKRKTDQYETRNTAMLKVVDIRIEIWYNGKNDRVSGL